jgi:hypothetical protein
MTLLSAESGSACSSIMSTNKYGGSDTVALEAGHKQTNS